MLFAEHISDAVRVAHDPVSSRPVPPPPDRHLRIHLHDGGHRLGEVHRYTPPPRLQSGHERQARHSQEACQVRRHSPIVGYRLQCQ